MKSFKSLREARKFLKTYKPKYISEDKSNWGIWHKKGTKTWWVGTHLHWLNLEVRIKPSTELYEAIFHEIDALTKERQKERRVKNEF